jgi:hypothetical protein
MGVENDWLQDDTSLHATPLAGAAVQMCYLTCDCEWRDSLHLRVAGDMSA